MIIQPSFVTNGKVSEKVWRFTLFQFGKLPGKLCFSSLCLALHGKLCFSSGHRDGRGTETGCVSETASLQFTSLASRKQWRLSGQRDSKALANQTSLGSGPMFGTVRWTYSLNITFSDVLFRVSSLKIPFWWSRNRLRKKIY